MSNFNANSAPVTRPHYPEDNDATIRHWASAPLIGNKEAIGKLNTIKNSLFGNIDKVDSLAHQWVSNQVMPRDWQLINDATMQLAGYWEGPAANQYNTYSNTTTQVLDKNQDAMQTMGNTLGDCVAQIYTTYKNCLGAISTCAGDLASLTAGLFVPVVGEAWAAEKAIEMLGDFVSSVNQLIADCLEQVGSYKQDGISFASAANKYTTPGEPGAAMGDPKKWKETK